MLLEKVTLEVPVELMRSARLVAEKTGAPIEQVLQSSLAHAFPPLDDLSPREAAEYASLALLDDAQLWEVARAGMEAQAEAEMYRLLDDQSADELNEEGMEALDRLLDEYGKTLTRTAHAYLLLARRGYSVPMQEDH